MSLTALDQFIQRGLDRNTFCLVPFSNLIFEPDGNVGMCRHKGSEFSIGNILREDAFDIWNGEKIRKIRRDILAGKNPTCSAEITHQFCNLCPQNNKLLDEIELIEYQSRPPLKITANFNGKCNLECQMCSIWKQPNGLYDKIKFWDWAERELFPYIREIDFLSGEPFIQKDTYRLIEILSNINPNCEWTLTTNAHWKLTDKIKSELNRIKIKNLIISIDSFDKKNYGHIRIKGDLDLVLRNVDDLLNYEQERLANGKNGLGIYLNFLVQKDNWHEIQGFIDYCKDKNIQPFPTFLYEPEEFSLLSLDLDERIKICALFINELSRNSLLRIQRVLSPLLNSIPRGERKKLVWDIYQRQNEAQACSMTSESAIIN